MKVLDITQTPPYQLRPLRVGGRSTVDWIVTSLAGLGQHLHGGIAILLDPFGELALLLACVGIYGVISYLVGQRMHEIGVRMALGAQRADVLNLVVRYAVELAIIGVAIGLSGALALTRFLSSLLFGVQPIDPPTLALISVLLTAVALLDSLIPALRATRVSPLVALHHE